MTTATLQSRLAAVQDAGRFDAVVVGGFARYIAEAPDEKLFRMNPTATRRRPASLSARR